MKKVLITGGTRGIGKAIALRFIKKGYRVCVTYSKDEESATKMREMGVETYKCDVRKENDIKSLFQRFGAVDILVNNAGVSLIKLTQDVSADEWDDLFAVNVRGAFLCSREAIKGMLSNQKGLIVNISSVWGEVGASCETAYSASKSALIGFTKALAKELAPSGIRVNCISPGVIDTKMNEHFSQDDLALIKEEIPVGRLGKSEEIASAVTFLEENEYITGVDLPVGGGFGF
ncbi:MAG: SDR family oxidoreductase [Clostridiales bacterium]|nr:SDR family oxidoreductase [Clostridiales bacterium]